MKVGRMADGRRDCGDPGHWRIDGGASAQALCGGGTGGGPEPERAVEPAGEGSGWGGGSSAGGDRLRRSRGGICAVVVALARGSLGGVRDRGWRESGDGASYAKKNDLKPWLKPCWCIPPKSDAQFAYAMEDVLEVYHRAYQDDEVLVCMDEAHR